MPTTSASGWDIHYETLGAASRPPILLTLGLSHRIAHWGRLPALCSGQLFVVMFDCRGMGESEKRDESYSISDEVGDMLAVLDAAGVQSAHIYGRSRGGMLAQEFALAHPDRARSLILSGTNHRGPGLVPSTDAVNAAMQLRPEMKREEIFATQNAAMASPGWRERDPAAFADLLATDLEAPPRRFAVDRQREAFALWSSYDRLEQISLPTLVLCGEDDGMVPPENSRQLAARIPGARLQLIPQCGHLAMREKPDEVATAVLEFIASI